MTEPGTPNKPQAPATDHSWSGVTPDVNLIANDGTTVASYRLLLSMQSNVFRDALCSDVVGMDSGSKGGAKGVLW